jgi:outer membrane lipoprotein SlyB
MAKKKKSEANLPSVSKPVAGGIAGAVIGGLVGDTRLSFGLSTICVLP